MANQVLKKSKPWRLRTGIWVACLALVLALLLRHPDFLQPAFIAKQLHRFGPYLWLVYAVVSMVRALTLIPSMPFVIAGALLFPSNPWLVLGLSMLGIAVSASALYWLADFLGWRERLQAHPKYPAMQNAVARFGAPFLTAWAFLPVVPTDLACLAAASAKMPFGRYLAAVCVGEAVLCSLLIFGIVRWNGY
jgi:uncharacterized membrane protein YdjX (TVP38/TMEM64 family)